jgi:hypothetical protein
MSTMKSVISSARFACNPWISLLQLKKKFLTYHYCVINWQNNGLPTVFCRTETFCRPIAKQYTGIKVKPAEGSTLLYMVDHDVTEAIDYLICNIEEPNSLCMQVHTLLSAKNSNRSACQSTIYIWDLMSSKLHCCRGSVTDRNSTSGTTKGTTFFFRKGVLCVFAVLLTWKEF